MRSVTALLEALTRAGISLEAQDGALKVRGPVGAVDPELRAELTARKADLLAALRDPAAAAAPTCAPLTHNQRRLWFLDTLSGTGRDFTMTAAWRLRGPLDRAALTQAIGALTRRHDILRATIAEPREGEPELMVAPWSPPVVAWDDAEPEDVDQLLAAAAAEPFDLTRGPLFRVRVATFGPHDHLLVLTMHHVISDRWSMGILVRDLAALMAGRDLPPLPLQFADVAARQRAVLDDTAVAARVAYWRDALAEAPADIALPFDRQRPAERGSQGAALRFALPPDGDLSRLAGEHGGTAFMAYLAAYAALLARWSGQDDIVVGCPMGSRDQAETFDLVGFFVNTVALRLDLSDDPDFLTLLERARRRTMDALAHQDAPFDRVVDALRPDRHVNRNPLFQAMFVVQTADLEDLAWPGVTAKPHDVPVMAPEVDINLALEPPSAPGGAFSGYLEYDPALFDAATAERFARQFASLCRAAAAQPRTPLSRLPLDDAPLAQWSGPSVALPEQTLDDLVTASLKTQPQALAVIEATGQTLTAEVLLGRVATLAGALRTAGVTPGARVGLALPRGADLVVSMLAVQRTGAAFVVLPQDAPPDHMNHITTTADLAAVIAPPSTDRPPGVAPHCPLLPPDAAGTPLDGVDGRTLDDIAYVCFTSGSTGTPKGVAVSHRAVVNHALAMVTAYGLAPDDRVLQVATPTFDVALEEIFPSLIAGAAVVVGSDAATTSLHTFSQEIAAGAVTVANLPAPFWHAWVHDMADAGAAPPPALRLVVTGSDRVHAPAAALWQRVAPAVRLLSGYGPTEATVTVLLHDPAEAPTAALTALPLGRPIANTTVCVVDPDGRPVPTGVVGEIVLEGTSLAAGYLGDVEASATGFRPRQAGGPPAYWTGDLARRHGDGSLEFLGRRDTQVKVRGIRVEPSGVETVFAACPGVSDCAVIARTTEAGQTALHGFITGSSTGEDARAWLADRLPRHMVPTTVERLDALPRLASGKIDRRTLSARPTVAAATAAAPTAPRDAREALVADLFAEVLKCGRVGPEGNFFALGGDSISSLQIVARARRKGLALTARDIFQHQSVAAIAAAAQDLETVPEGASGAGPLPLTPIHAWFHGQVKTDWHHFNQSVMLAIPRPVDIQALTAALTALADCHDILRVQVTEGDDGFCYNVPATPGGRPVPVTVLDLTGLPAAQRAARRAACFADVQAGLDPRVGRNMAAVVLPDEARMMLTIHHICVDVLSWGPLLDDLETAYGKATHGVTPDVQRIGTPFRHWAERLHDAARQPTVGNTPQYWLGLLGHPADRLLPEAGSDPGTEATTTTARRMVGRAITGDILRSVPAAFGARADETLLAALLDVLRRRGGSRLRVDLERNGRVSPFADLDLSRTVGWFTSVMPLYLQSQETEPRALLRVVGQAVADSPLDGLGYGLLRYLSKAPGSQVLACLPPAELLLNFVGTLSGWNECDFRPVDEDCGPTIAASMPRTHPLELNAGVIEGQLRLELSYPDNAACSAEAEALMDDLVDALTDLARAARLARAGVDDVPPDVEAVLPLTPLQRGILLHSLHEPETYFDQLHLTLSGPLDLTALRAAWARVFARHNGLRASFRAGDGQAPVQFLYAEGTVAPGWTEMDWRTLDATSLDARLGAFMAADRVTGFDLEQPPLMRLAVIHSGPQRFDLVWSSHHLILDGWSVSVVMEEVLALYREARGGRSAALPPAPDFASYLTWLQTVDVDASRDYWRHALTGLAPTLLADALASPGGSPSPRGQAGGPSSAVLDLTADEAARIDAFTRAQAVTLGTLVQGAWAVLLSRHTGQDDVAFGLTVSGRSPDLPGVERMVGMLINTLPMRLAVPGTATVGDWLRSVGQRAADAAAHAATPLPEALDAAGLSSAALPFDSLVLVQNYPRPDTLDAGDLSVALTTVAEATSFPLTVVTEWATRPRLLIVYSDRRIAAEGAQALLARLRTLILGMVDAPAVPLDALSVFDAPALVTRLALARGDRLAVPPPLAHEVVDDWATLAPGAPAVVAWDATLTYGELTARSDSLAARLARAGVRRGSRVALALPRSAQAIVSALAILKAGGAFVPLDVTYPRSRLDVMLADSRPDLVVTDTAHRDRFADSGTPLLDVTAEDDMPAGAWSPPALTAEDACYVIYTSGSTGTPKGVVNAHGGLRNLIHAQRGLFRLGPGDRVLQAASLSFDASVWEMVMALGAGAALHVPDRADAMAGAELAVYLRRHRITAATIPPSLLAVLPESPLPDLRILVVAGEACPPTLARRWAGGRRFFNAYGPSEATVCATIHEGGGDGVTLPIGRPIANTDAHVVDAALRPVPPGGEGELLVGGAGVALGYLDRPAMTADRFIPDPAGGGGTLYRTGDRVRLLADGGLLFLGRMDRQVKLRGFRIEPGDVEAALAAYPDVARAVAGPRPDAHGDARLLAWVVPRPGTRPQPQALRQALRDSLPDHMVPAAILVIDSLPLTPNGKIDWAALPDVETASATAAMSPAAPSPNAPPATPEDAIEERLKGIWTTLLGHSDFGPDDHFFDLGGHSLLLVRMQPLLKETFGIAVKTADLFAHPTLRSLSRQLLDAGAMVPEPERIAEAPSRQIRTAASPPLAEPIAVVGMAGRFPGAADIDAFWDMLIEAREGLSHLDRATLAAAGVPLRLLDDPAFVPVSGMIDDAEAFDPAVFGIGPRDALVLDPQHRVFLECAWHALENGGYAPRRTGARVGVFAGCGHNTWLHDVLRPAGEDVSGSGGFLLVTGNDKDFLATQAAYRLDLKGPALSVQSACSTSLVAIASAVAALRAGDCDMALAGGVSIRFPQGQGYAYERDMILSPDGHCRPFAADAAGTVPGAGAGVVLLKPLSRARADGDTILAVVRGSAVTNDGAAKMGFTAPGVEGQADAIRAALASAGLTADDIDYVETHGTGTALGDPVEVTALGRVLGGRREPLLLGSVKSNIGHADAAAGVIGFIKTVLALHHGLLPASLHAQPPNPRIDFAAGPFAVVDRTQPWPRRDRPHRAGVSSFGIGGTNAHVILEAAPAAPATATNPPPGDHVIVLSAQTETALQRQAEALAAHLRSHPRMLLADAAYTLQCGRTPLPHRRAILARTSAEAVEALLDPAAGVRGQVDGQPPALALLLPGQGSQHPRMGQALYEADPAFRNDMDAMAESLRPALGLSLTDLLYGPQAGDAETLARTEIVQPAVFAVSVAMARRWQALGLSPEGMLGHSLGEYVAAHLAGVFSLDNALALVAERGRLIGALPGGAMLAVSLAEAETRALLDDNLSLAAVNGPRQCVVSGPEDAIAGLVQRLHAAGLEGRRLRTSHAFHSPLLEPAAMGLAAAIARAAPSAPVTPYVSNLTGTWITAEQATSPDYWVRQMLSPVRFADGLATLREAGAALAVECGPGQALSTLAAGQGLRARPTLPPTADNSGTAAAPLATAAALWTEGVEIAWTALHPGPRRRLPLPLYPFDRQAFTPGQAGGQAMAPRPTQDRPAKRPAMGRWFYRPGWTPADEAVEAALQGPVLILADDGGVGATLAARLMAAGVAVTLITVRDLPDLPRLLAALPEPPRRVLHLAGLDEADAETLEERGLHALLALARALGRGCPADHHLRLDMVTRGAAEVTGREPLRPSLAAAVGALRVLPVEYPNLTVRAIDVETTAATPPHRVVDAARAEMERGGDATVVALRDGDRWVPEVRPLALPAAPPDVIRADAVILITGAFGGVGRALARDLASEPGVRLVLVGRRAADEAQGAFITDLEALGATVLAVAANVADADALAAVVAEATERLGPLTGVIHAAGVADAGGVVDRRERAETDRVLAPKVAGTRALEQALAGHRPDFVILCSTLGSFLPAAKFGQIAYAAANEYLDLAAPDMARRTGWPVTAVNWDDWVDAGMTVQAYDTWGLPAPTADDGLTAAEGAAALRRILAGDTTRVAVSVRDLTALMAGAGRLFEPSAAAIPAKAAGATITDLPVGKPRPDGDLTVDRLAAAFGQVLGVPDVGADDDFFRLGGHSLLAMRLLAVLRTDFAAHLGIADLFDCPTPRGLAPRLTPRREVPARLDEEPA